MFVSRCILSLAILSLSLITNSIAMSSMDYAAVLTDRSGQRLSGITTIDLTVSLHNSIQSSNPVYLQTYSQLEIIDGLIQVRLGPNIPPLSEHSCHKITVNGETLEPCRKFLVNPMSLNAGNASHLNGMTQSELISPITSELAVMRSTIQSNFVQINSISNSLQSSSELLLTWWTGSQQVFGFVDSSTGAVQKLGHLGDLQAFGTSPTLVGNQIHMIGRDHFGRNALYIADVKTGEFLRKVLLGSTNYHIIGPVQHN